MELYASTREEELELTGWDDRRKRDFVQEQFHAQSVHYARHYPAMSSDIVLVEGRRAGRLLVNRGESEIRIVDVTLAPEYRRRGVGAELISALQDEADRDGKAVSIHVERFNPAQRLYRRLGFEVAEDKGVYLLMMWRPDPEPTR
ncbi:MAG TPA: GNAT family N-acetyltransferase [Actinomycetota bacterium]|nr:GNAT family N-acetyltransferase [Actinomycetota bacterium]